jgi:hypothetical protein
MDITKRDGCFSFRMLETLLSASLLNANFKEVLLSKAQGPIDSSDKSASSHLISHIGSISAEEIKDVARIVAEQSGTMNGA